MVASRAQENVRVAVQDQCSGGGGVHGLVPLEGVDHQGERAFLLWPFLSTREGVVEYTVAAKVMDLVVACSGRWPGSA